MSGTQRIALAFPLKVIAASRYGYAAGCAAVASPRRSYLRRHWAMPLDRARPIKAN